MKAVVTVNIKKSNDKTRLINDSFLKSMEANSKLVARMAAFQLHKSTLPETFSMPWNKAFVKMKNKIHQDVNSAYATKQDEIKKERIELTSALINLKQKHQDPFATIERTKKLFLDCNKAKSEYLEALPERKREIAYLILSNAQLLNKNMAQPQLKSPYDLIARTPKNAEFSTLCTLWDDVRTILNA